MMRAIGSTAVVLALLGLQAGAAPGAVTAAVAQAPWATLRGEARDGAVQLTWEISEWPADVSGFVVRWRPVDAAGTATGAWVTLNERPITPGMSLAKDLSNVEPDAQRRRELQQDLQRRIAAGEAAEVSAQEFIATVRRDPAVLEALTREIREDPRRALFIGLGCVDRGLRPGETREYALFPVRGAAALDREPVASFVTPAFAAEDPRLRVTDLTVTARPAGTYLSWRFEEAKVQEWSIFGFNVYRAVAGSGDFELVSPGGVGGPRIEQGWRYFTFVDNGADETTAWTYAVAPLSTFGTELTTRTTVEYAPAAPAAAPPAPATPQVEQGAGGEVVVSWTYDAAPAAAVSGFVVERMDLPDGDLTAISDLLPANARSFVDRDAKEDQAAYAYVVAAQDEAGALYPSPIGTLLYIDRRLPPAPTGVSAEVVKVGDTTYVQLTWDPIAADDSLTEGFVLYADKVRAGVVSLQASIPLIRSNEYFLEIPALETREYTIAVAGEATGGVLGPATEVRVLVPGALPAAPTGAAVDDARLAAEGVVELRWDYPEGLPLHGFRVSVDGRVVEDERILGAEARSWTFADPRPDRTYELAVVAVTPDGLLSQPTVVLFTARRTRLGDGLRNGSTGGPR